MVSRVEAIRAALRAVPDPEIPVVDIVGLGMVREVTDDEVVLTTTWTGCPATDVIRRDVAAALARAGFDDVRLRQEIAPPWTTDAIDEETREKLRAYGIAPPGRGRRLEGTPCPRCGARDTELVSEFGSTPCKASMRCTDCLEPFEAFKCL